MSNPGFAQVEDILSIITMAFANPRDRGQISRANRDLRDNVTIGRTRRGGEMMRNAIARHRLTRFPEVLSLDKKIREIVPPFWIVATAMSNHATSEERREHAAKYVEDRQQIYTGHQERKDQTRDEYLDSFSDNHEYRRMLVEYLLHIQYHLHPDDTLRTYFRYIMDSNNIAMDLDRAFNVATRPQRPQRLLT